MKKVVAFLFLVMLLVSVVSPTRAEILGRKVFAISGDFVEFIPFSFVVPSGNCSNVRVFEYKQTYYYPSYSPAHWEELTPGSVVKSYSLGIFWFKVDGSVCSPEVVVQGPLFDMDVYGVWSAIEVEPEDLGLLVKNVMASNNYFNLPTGTLYSYEIIFTPYGRKYTLSDLVSFANDASAGIRPAGSTLVGAIVPDERGFLSKVLFDPSNIAKSIKNLKNQSKNIILYDDQPVVLIFKENY